MGNIFEQLDIILKSINEQNEADEANESAAAEQAKEIIKEIPINPDMETADQGIAKAEEKLAKYFYELSMVGFGGMPVKNNDIDLPDDWLEPILKGKISGQNKEFRKNKVVWDPEEEMEKLEKEIEMNSVGGDDSDFDDFDYYDNQFGDDANTDDLETDGGGSGSGSSNEDDKSEQERLNDAINKAIDQLRDNKESGDESGSQSGQESGSQSGSQSGGQQSGSQSGSQDGGQQSGGQQSGSQSGSQDGSQSGSQSGSQTGNGHSSSSGNGQSAKDKQLSQLKDALAKGDASGVGQAMDTIKEGEDGTGNLAGENIGEVSDKTLSDDMKSAGISDEDIKEMQDAKNENTSEDFNEDEMNRLKREVIDGLEKKCKKRGGSALSRTIVRSALKSKVNDDEWKKMLKMFLKSKAVNKGDMADADRNDIKMGDKNHLWRNAVLPTMTVGQGEIQNIYCIIDFSGSVDQDLVYTFLGRVINLCAELHYTNVVVYGLGDDKLTLPRTITSKMIKKDGIDVVLSQTWDFIDKQEPGGGGTDFGLAIDEMLEIVRKQRDAVFLIFGDAYWSEMETMPLHDKLGEKICKQICMLLYYDQDNINDFAGYVAILKELVKLPNIITTKASHITE